MIQFKLENGFKLDLEKSDKVFTPTGTTEVIIEGISPYIDPKSLQVQATGKAIILDSKYSLYYKRK